MPGEQEGPTGVLVSSILALMAFLLAVTMGMASDRFDTRRQLVVQEANAISTTYLEADYLPQPAADQMKELLREYLPLRIANTSDRSVVQANFQSRRNCTHRCGDLRRLRTQRFADGPHVVARRVAGRDQDAR